MLKPGDAIDIWVVDRALGQGGMGSVYRCHNREAKRILAAVKVLDAALGRQEHAKARFIREAEILFSLDHPGIVKVRNVRMDLAMPYLEMEFIDGVNLDAHGDGPMPAARALPLFRQVADALAYLHGKGIRHRDIKPSNILVQPSGVVKLVDFGIATEADGATITQQGQTFGSVSYAPPEWLEPEVLDPVRWDIYAAGVVFWEVLTGVQAFPMSGVGTMQQQVVRMIGVKQRHPPLDPGPTVPRALRELIRDMTQPHWPSRIADAEVVRARLAAVDLADIDPAAAATPRTTPTWFPEEPLEPSHGEDGRGPPGGGGPSIARAGAGATMVPDFDTEEGSRPPRPAAVPPPGGEAPRAAPPGAVPQPASRPRLLPMLAFVGILGAVAAAIGLAPLFAPPDTRDVTIQVGGLPPGTPVAVTLGGAAPTEVVGHTLRFVDVPVGPAALRAAVGAGCAATDADPAWCASSRATVAVDAEREPLTHALALTPPAARALALTFAGLPAGAAPQARVDGGAPVIGDADGVTLPDVLPGTHVVSVLLGLCTEVDVGCDAGGDAAGDPTPGAAKACPPGCTAWQGPVVVPVGEGPVQVPVPLTVAPAAVADARATQGRAAEARPADASRARGAGGIVTASAFSRWLGTHPEWAPDAARAAGKADAGYLSGWAGTEPPPGKAGHAVVNVPWGAASAYCAGRGGLADIDAAPLKWTESTAQPWHEYRDSGGRPAWRRAEGDTSLAVKRSESSAFIGFRCAR